MVLAAAGVFTVLEMPLSPLEDTVLLRVRKWRERRRWQGRDVDTGNGMDVDGVGDGGDEDNDVETREDALMRQTEAQICMKQVVYMSIVLNDRNARCNKLQSLVSVFLHACNALESVVEFTSHWHRRVSGDKWPRRHGPDRLFSESIGFIRKLRLPRNSPR
ncbi:hypothetical protein MKEN_00933200 [Mycena kentingensis (nom. inval.)]|nr:hypothetical protein MKEN_00933200 [Mycena kentingensis (nom. inval.)]